MKNVIAVIWDCDKTLIDGYMQDPMFAEYGVETKQFWADENKILDEYQKTGVRVNRDTYYLNYFINITPLYNFRYKSCTNALYLMRTSYSSRQNR